MRVLDLIGRDNVRLSDSRMGEILTMVQKESLLEEVEKAEAQLESAAKVASDIQEGKQVSLLPCLIASLLLLRLSLRLLLLRLL